MVIHKEQHAKYLSLAIGVITLLYILRLNLLFLKTVSSRAQDFLTTRIYIEIAFVTILAVLISRTRMVVENMNQSEFMVCIRVAMISLLKKTYRKEKISKIEIEQDGQRYYCLNIRFQDSSQLLIARFPNLMPVEEKLSQLKMELGV